MKYIFFALLSAVSVVASAEEITIDRAVQRYPWNAMVDIDYTVSGISDPLYYEVEFTLSGKKRDGGGFSVIAATFLGGVPVSNGTHRATWDANADGIGFFAPEVSITANLKRKPIKEDGDYMIVDLTGGTNAAVWRVTYMSDVENPDETFNTDEYKTTKIVLRKVKAGGFYMGSESNPQSPFYDDKAVFSNSNSGEDPRHYVMLTKDYFIGLFKLTSAQYEAITGAKTPYDAQYYADKPHVPATGISRDSLDQDGFFFLSLNSRAKCIGKERSSFDLPTEAQWERAARAGTTTRYFFGDDPAPLADYAWYDGKTTTPSWGRSYQKVGSLLPNPWGLYDVYGNGMEHVRDTTGVYAAGDEENPVVNPVKSGSWGTIMRSCDTWGDDVACRSAFRGTATTASSSGTYSLRLVYQCD